MAQLEVLVGTTKGLIRVVRTGEGIWKAAEVFFRGLPASMFFEDDRNGTWWTGLAHRHWGAKLQYSHDRGATWRSAALPSFADGLKLPNGKAATLRKLWCMAKAQGHGERAVWLGVEPGALFLAKDESSPFELLEGLWNHPSRQDPNKWFGAGRDYSFIHSIATHPDDPERLFIGVSCAGVFESRNNGDSWEARNKGLVAAYLPNPSVEVGHDPHNVQICRSVPNVMWQQNHCGIFRSEDGGVEWKNVTDQNGLANYGFALAIDHNDPMKAWVIPAVSDEERIAADLALCVCETTDGGSSWHALREGLPQSFCFDIVFRQSFTRVGSIMAFGTSNGNLYISENDGRSWSQVTGHFARVENVTIIEKK